MTIHRRETTAATMVLGMFLTAGAALGGATETDKTTAITALRTELERLRAIEEPTAKDKGDLNAAEDELIERAKDLCGDTEHRRALDQALEDAQGEVQGDDAETVQTAQTAMQGDEALQELEKVEEVLGFPICKKLLYDDFRSYDGWGFSFKGGAEWVSVSEIFQTDRPLIDLVVYRDFATPRRWRWLPKFDIHAQLTNSAEALSALAGEGGMEGMDGMDDMDGMDPGEADGSMADDMAMAEAEVESALSLNVSFFVPFKRFEINGGRLRDYLGLYGEFGFRDLDSLDRVDARYYGGLRLAFNPDWYVDLLYGRTDSLESDRLEFRGQFPVAPLSKNSRIYLGLVANLGLDEPAGVDEEDVVRVYALWNLDVKAFFQGLRNGG